MGENTKGQKLPTGEFYITASTSENPITTIWWRLGEPVEEMPAHRPSPAAWDKQLHQAELNYGLVWLLCFVSLILRRISSFAF